MTSEDAAQPTPPKPRSLLWLALFAGATAVAAGLGAGATRRGRGAWYRALSKPAGQPPAQVFGPVWTALYGLMSVSAYRVFRTPPSPARTRALRLWWGQLALNGAWSPLFFGAHRARLALADLVGLTVAVADYTRTAGKVDRPAAWLMTPYLGWLGYAGWLNLGIVRKNPRLAG
ncbi:MAG: TspO/MBR family protein [Polyangia bacterium]